MSGYLLRSDPILPIGPVGTAQATVLQYSNRRFLFELNSSQHQYDLHGSDSFTCQEYIVECQQSIIIVNAKSHLAGA